MIILAHFQTNHKLIPMQNHYLNKSPLPRNRQQKQCATGGPPLSGRPTGSAQLDKEQTIHETKLAFVYKTRPRAPVNNYGAAQFACLSHASTNAQIAN
jgi:hypothetical protein